MDEQEMRVKLLAFKQMTGADDATITRLLSHIQDANKQAASQGIAFKADGLKVYEIAGKSYINVDGSLMPLDALETGAKADDVTIETDSPEAAAAAADPGAEMDDTGETRLLSDITVDELKDIFRQVIQESAGALAEVDEKMASMGYQRAQKEAQDGVNAVLLELKATKEKQAQLEALIAGLVDPNAMAKIQASSAYRPSTMGPEVDSALTLELARLQSAQKSSANNANQNGHAANDLDDMRNRLFPGM